jgi:threonine/homoserine/homoserine lactone efflux protein
MGGVDAELGLVALAAMLSPTTLSFSVLALVIGDRPLRTGAWFYLGALTATLAVGVVAAFVVGDVAASNTSTPKTWVAVVDVVAGVYLALYVVRMMRRPPNPEQAAGMIERMGKVASSPAIAIVGAGAMLANPGGFIPLALKEISETDPSAAEYVTEWVLFSLVALLPLAVALVMLLVARERTVRVLTAARGWLERHARTIAAVLLFLIAAALLRNGIAGLTSG